MFTSGPTTQNELRDIGEIAVRTEWFILEVAMRIFTDEFLVYFTTALRTFRLK